MRSSEDFKQVLHVLTAGKPEQRVIVFSAISGVTDTLLEIISTARNDLKLALTHFVGLREKHEDILKELLGNEKVDPELFNADFESYSAVLKSVFLAKRVSVETESLFSGLGEIWCCRIFQEFAKAQGKSARIFDSREIIRVRDNDAEVDWKYAKFALEKISFSKGDQILIFAGYVASTEEGAPTTLGRNGSDYSAAILANLFNATKLVIWKEVPAVFTSDPQKVAGTQPLAEIDYDEILELANLGAKVVHPRAIGPAVEKNIPIQVRGLWAFPSEGTMIRRTSKSVKPSLISGIVLGRSCRTIQVQIRHSCDQAKVVSRISAQVFPHFNAQMQVSRDNCTTQVQLMVEEGEFGALENLLREELFHELNAQECSLQSSVSRWTRISAVTDHEEEASDKVIQTLSQSHAPFNSLENFENSKRLSLTVPTESAVKLVNELHTSFFGEPRKKCALALVGVGSVGSQLLKILANAKAGRLQEEISVCAVSNSKQMIIGEESGRRWIENSADKESADLDRLIRCLEREKAESKILVDCTASPLMTARYAELLSKGIHVVTANKIAGSSDIENYRLLFELQKHSGSKWLYEATVGAGLPIISTLRELRVAGDRIRKIEGVFSGTLSYIFNQTQQGKSFPDVLRAAIQQNYTEPDPRADLSGLDKARKLVILGRECGWNASMEKVQVQNLVPENMRSISVDDFKARINEIEVMPKGPRDGQSALKYMGSIAEDHATVGLTQVASDHPAFGMKGSDNLFVIWSDRYSNRPLVISGPGAGPEVTAHGILCDVARLIQAPFEGGTQESDLEGESSDQRLEVKMYKAA